VAKIENRGLWGFRAMSEEKEPVEALVTILKLVREWQPTTWSEPWVKRLEQVEKLAHRATTRSSTGLPRYR
jgi:hypothetical protein